MILNVLSDAHRNYRPFSRVFLLIGSFLWNTELAIKNPKALSIYIYEKSAIIIEFHLWWHFCSVKKKLKKKCQEYVFCCLRCLLPGKQKLSKFFSLHICNSSHEIPPPTECACTPFWIAIQKWFPRLSQHGFTEVCCNVHFYWQGPHLAALLLTLTRE